MKHTGNIRFGIIGTGKIAINAHVPAIRHAGEEVVALADVAEGRARRYADELGIPHAFTDYRELVALDEVDAISVCTPPDSHEEIAIAAFRSGKHVYLEKPVALDEASIKRIYEASREADKRLLVGSHLVYLHEIQLIKRLADRGDLGHIYMVKGINVSRRAMPHGWFRKKSIGGGFAIIDGGSHILDRVLYVLGNPKPVSVVGRVFRHFASAPPVVSYKPQDYEDGRDGDIPEMEVEDSGTAFIQFDNGCVLFLENSTASNSQTMNDIWFYGTKAGASINPLKTYGEEMPGLVTDTLVSNVGEAPKINHLPAFSHLIQCIREGRDTESNGERSVNLMKIVDAIYESAEQGGREIRF